ncbi:tyrosine-type recombinase/integrase [Kribbella sp. NPDC002412]
MLWRRIGSVGSTSIRRLGRFGLRRCGRWLASRVVDPASAIKYESALRLHVGPVFGRRQLRTIKPSEIAAWVADLDARFGSSTARVRRFWCCTGRWIWRWMMRRSRRIRRRHVRSRCRRRRAGRSLPGAMTSY